MSLQHVGDLGNVLADTSGRAAFRKIDKFLKIPDIIGRSLIITKDPDDLGRGNSPESKINGNSGARYEMILIVKLYDNCLLFYIINFSSDWLAVL